MRSARRCRQQNLRAPPRDLPRALDELPCRRSSRKAPAYIEGQQLALALAVVLTARPRVVMLDEPTRGLDYTSQSAPQPSCSGTRRRRPRRGRGHPRRGVRGPGGRRRRGARRRRGRLLRAGHVGVVAGRGRSLRRSPDPGGPVAARRRGGERGEHVVSAPRAAAVPLRARSLLVPLSVASVAGLMMLTWPLLVRVGPGLASTRRSCSWRCCPWSSWWCWARSARAVWAGSGSRRPDQCACSATKASWTTSSASPASWRSSQASGRAAA